MDDATIVLIHSPLVGPATWSAVAAELDSSGNQVIVPSGLGFERSGTPYWPAFVDAVVAACDGADGELRLVGHSGAGSLLPRIADELGDRVDSLMWAEASLAPASGAAELAPPWLIDQLRPMVVDGRLPPWSQWWGPGAMERLLPDAERRREIEAELPALPLDYFLGTVPVPDGWEQRWPRSFVWFSEALQIDAEAAAARGWPVTRLDGTHLHMVTAPAEVAEAILSAP